MLFLRTCLLLVASSPLSALVGATQVHPPVEVSAERVWREWPPDIDNIPREERMAQGLATVPDMQEAFAGSQIASKEHMVLALQYLVYHMEEKMRIPVAVKGGFAMCLREKRAKTADIDLLLKATPDQLIEAISSLPQYRFLWRPRVRSPQQAVVYFEVGGHWDPESSLPRQWVKLDIMLSDFLFISPTEIITYDDYEFRLIGVPQHVMMSLDAFRKEPYRAEAKRQQDFFDVWALIEDESYRAWIREKADYMSLKDRTYFATHIRDIDRWAGDWRRMFEAMSIVSYVLQVNPIEAGWRD